MKSILTASIAAAAVVLVSASANAQNNFFAPGDLVLTFQNPGGATGSDQTLYVGLGSAAFTFRDATSNLINIVNIGSALTTAFGFNWFDASTLYWGAVAAESSSSNTTTVASSTNDPHRTSYVTKGRTLNIDGNLGIGGTTTNGVSLTSNTARTSSASNIIAVLNQLETLGTTAVLQLDTGASTIDNQNPFTVPFVQSTAYGVYSGGVQSPFGAGNLGSLGPVTGVESALDLFRLQAANTISGQNGFGESIPNGRFEGTLVIDNGGNVSFIVVPEPASVALLGLAAGVAAFARRRKNA
jgi:hypothetical protein